MPFYAKGPGAGTRARARVFVRMRKLIGTTDNTPAPAAQACLPFVTMGEAAAQVIFRARARVLCRRGDRLVGELLAETTAERSTMTLIEQKFDRFLNLDDAVLDLVGGRQMPRAPLYAVPR